MRTKKTIEFTKEKEMPKTPTGKIIHLALREQIRQPDHP